ncbi:MAG TPA: hypothetical protein VHX39_06520 [Acetobacteraceae bacterium]|jgi:hypothetical protein|nr:hypothetical protein [Acetobacteraceae bacterium]
MGIEEWFEYVTSQDPSLNYCLWPYQAPAPGEDKFRSVNLLYQSFAFAGINERAFAVVDAIRDGIGAFKTVFGVKLADGRLGWEFYFYDYKRRQRVVSMSHVLRAIHDYMPTRIRPNERLPYFMFSLDLNNALVTGAVPLDVVHMYIGNPGSQVSSGIAYAIREDSISLENFYFFFDARTQLADVAGKIGSAAVFDDTVLPIDAVLRPELRRCQTICLANKQSHDCIYFSGVDVDQLQWFLDWQQYPPEVTAFIRTNRSNLDHLLFDVGFDYRMVGDRLLVIKSGYYGVF